MRNPGLTLTYRGTAEQLRVTGDDAGRFEFADLEPADSSLVVRVASFERLFSTVLAGRGGESKKSWCSGSALSRKRSW